MVKIGQFRGNTEFYDPKLLKSICAHRTKILYIVPAINDLGADEYHIKTSSRNRELNWNKEYHLRYYLDTWQ